MPNFNPVIRKRYLEIPQPSLSDTLGDCQRLLREFKDKLWYKKVKVNLSLLENMGRILRVGNEGPKGICGSGLINLLAQLLEWGIINRQGKINAEIKSSALFLPHTDMSLFPSVKI